MTLFEEYAACFTRGERPDLREYMARAGEDGEELAQLVDTYLARVEPPPPDEESVALTQAWIDGQPPLAELRSRRGLKREQVVDRLIEIFNLDPRKRPKVARYYHEVETGQRVPADEGLLAALAEILRTRVSDILALRSRPLEAEPAYLRAASPVPAPTSQPSAAREEEADEVDLLFRARG